MVTPALVFSNFNLLAEMDDNAIMHSFSEGNLNKTFWGTRGLFPDDWDNYGSDFALKRLTSSRSLKPLNLSFCR